MEPRIFAYKIVTDNGGAPCVARGLLTLAICKPMIRTSAREGDLIFGFGSNGRPMSNRLIYIAEVTKAPMTDGTYYETPAYRTRADCIYERASDGRLVIRARAKHHRDGDHRRRDVGSWPAYQKATVLISTDLRYFGRNGTADYLKDIHYPLIAQMVKGMRQGHRVNHMDKLRQELFALKVQIWKRYAKKMTLGLPTDPKDRRPCNTDSPSVSC